MTDYTISGFSSTSHGSTQLGPFVGSTAKYTSFDQSEAYFRDPDPLATQGSIDNSLGFNAYKLPSTQGYGDGGKLEYFLNTNARYDIVNMKIRSTSNIDTNNRISLGGNKQEIGSGAGFGLYTRNTGFAFQGDNSFDEIGTLPTMNANTWYEITYALDWSFAQRAVLPVVSLWVDGAIAINQVTPAPGAYTELTGGEERNFRLAFFGSTPSNQGDTFFDDIRVVCGDTLPWGMGDATITNPDNLITTTYTGGAPYFVSLTAANEFTLGNFSEAPYGDVTVTPGGGDVRPSSGVVYPRGSVRLD
jgi:hypothetical protein